MLVPQEALNEMDDGLDFVIKYLTDHGIVLSDDERKALLGLGTLRAEFTGYGFEFAEKSPDMLPRFVDIEKFRVNYTNHKALKRLYVKTEAIQRMLKDMLLYTGDQSYRTALECFNSAKRAVYYKIPGADFILKKMKECRKRLAKGKKADESAQTEAQAAAESAGTQTTVAA
jgi:hypothetical protein